MTDSSGLRGDWLVVLSGALAVLVAGVVTLVVRTGDPTSADTYLSGTRNAALVLTGGREVVAKDGMRVPNGTVVRTGDGGAATLTTDGRDVYLGALSTVLVRDGLRQTLQRGQVMSDGRNGPRLQLSTSAGLASVASGALVRVEMGPVLRFGVFAGSGKLTADGRQVSTPVSSLHQLQAPYVGLPGLPTVLALTDDAWEQRLDGALVDADRDLNELARGLSGPSGVTVLTAAPVALRQVPASSLNRGEQALSVVMAQAAQGSGSAQQNLARIEADRSQGGSWGVVAALVHARVSSVSALLDNLLAPPGGPPPILAGPPPVLPNLFGPSPTSGPGPSGGPSGSPSPSTTTRPTATPTHTVSPSPSAVDQVISTVTGLLGSPSPSSKVQPSLSPSPLHRLLP